jgi:molybdopterin converting factor small subunit
MTITVKLFARARDLAGTDRVELELPEPGYVKDVREGLATRFPQLSPLVPKLLVAVGSDYARDDVSLSPNADVACFPPVSGG